MKPQRLALWVWYRGEPFIGFQRQPNGPTIQGTLQNALVGLGIEATPIPAGRTDKGVSARMQVVAIRTAPPDDLDELVAKIEKALPSQVGICMARRTKAGFHPQWSCQGKEYRYRLALKGAPLNWQGQAWQVDGAQPERVAQLLSQAVGRRDFSAFHEKSSPVGERTLQQASLCERQPGLFEVTLRGDRFARYQVRYLVGSAVKTARGELSVDAWTAALEQARPIQGLKAPALGLTLWEVFYPPELDPFSPRDRQALTNLPLEPPFI